MKKVLLLVLITAFLAFTTLFMILSIPSVKSTLAEELQNSRASRACFDIESSRTGYADAILCANCDRCYCQMLYVNGSIANDILESILEAGGAEYVDEVNYVFERYTDINGGTSGNMKNMRVAITYSLWNAEYRFTEINTELPMYYISVGPYGNGATYIRGASSLIWTKGCSCSSGATVGTHQIKAGSHA